MATKSVFLRAGFNYDTMQASDESALRCEDKSLAQQSFKEECDINTIMERFGHGAALPQGFRAPMYGDFTGLGDYRSAIEAVHAAGDAFLSMPAQLRARFENDPAKLIDFVSNESNREEAVRLGLIPEKPAVPGAPAEPVKGAEPPAKPVA